jgi:agmatine/peptidylarginine deiminase
MAHLPKAGISFPGRYDVVPTYRNANDERALGILHDCFPGRPVTGLDSSDMIWGLGSLHCITQQESAVEQLANAIRSE